MTLRRFLRMSALLLVFAATATSNANCGGGADSGGRPAAAAPRTIRTALGIEMVQLPGGWFEMGNEGGSADERPAHRVWVDAFLIDRYEVTQDQYRLLELSDPSRFQGANLPVEQRTWLDAIRFCNVRSHREGLQPCYDEETGECNFQANGYRLPSEAEWEYAARAGTARDYHFGNDPRQLTDYAWYGENSAGKTHPVGLKEASPWGLFDMYGNVAEWCHDFFAQDYYRNSPRLNPRGPAKGELRVVRGGAWNSSAGNARSTSRGASASVNDDCLVSDAVGFRCVRRAPSTTTPAAR